MKEAKIVTLTINPALDKSADVDRVEPDKKLRCRHPRYDAGGGGINVARAVNEMGEDARAVFLAGGRCGDRLTELLEKEEVPHQRIEIDQETRQHLIVLEEESGRQFRFGMPGPEIGSEDCDRVLQSLAELESAPEFLVIAGSLPPGIPDDFYAQVVEAAGQRGTRVIVDACGEPLRRALEAQPFMIKPNLRELGDLAGKEMESDEEIEAAAGKLVDEGNCDICTVSLGAGGALLVSKNGIHRIPSPTVPIRSKVGAGDCSVAGIVTALSRGHSEKEALAMGVAAGAAAVMTPGTELCRRRDVDRLFQALQKKEKESTS